MADQFATYMLRNDGRKVFVGAGGLAWSSEHFTVQKGGPEVRSPVPT